MAILPGCSRSGWTIAAGLALGLSPLEAARFSFLLSIPAILGASLLELLRQLQLDPRTVVVEHNRKIVRRSDLATIQIAAGDSVELVHFVGGG